MIILVTTILFLSIVLFYMAARHFERIDLNLLLYSFVLSLKKVTSMEAGHVELHP